MLFYGYRMYGASLRILIACGCGEGAVPPKWQSGKC